MENRYLFKAKRFDNGEWVKGALIYDDMDKLYRILIELDYSTGTCIRAGKAPRVDASTICQCTGLKDKNGKLIWENDIMQAHLDDSFPENATYTRVVWNNNGFCTKEQGSEDISPLDKFDQEYFEVCGNIFNNPELLEVK